MTTLSREEQKAVEALDKAQTALEALSFEEAVHGAILEGVASLKTFVVNRAITRENADLYPVPPVVEIAPEEINVFNVDLGDSGTAVDKGG